jgi:hypothetical protein
MIGQGDEIKSQVVVYPDHVGYGQITIGTGGMDMQPPF